MTPPVVACELVTRDRDSFDEWWPLHLAGVLELADLLYLRVDNDSYDDVMAVLDRFLEDNADTTGQRWSGPGDTIVAERQYSHFGRWQEDAERDALLGWALETGADWCAVFDADEVIEPGGGRAVRQMLLETATAGTFRVLGVHLNYISHHRPGWTLPRCGVEPARVFRLDSHAAGYRFHADGDGLHCGSVPWPSVGLAKVPELRVVHYHACSPAEFMGERAFYDNTVEVTRNGGIDWLYRCDRFGTEAAAVPIDELLAGRDERLARIAAGVGVTR